ncbi:MAG: AAA family ATPase [Acidimicrobiia bacterium]
MSDAARVRLAGALSVTSGSVRLDGGRFPGRQGRIVFAALILAAARPVERDRLAEIVWPNTLPRSWTRDLSVIISKLRALLGDDVSITTGHGRWYALAFRDGCRVDIVDARTSVEDAERWAANDEMSSASHKASDAIEVLREPLLAGDDCPWVEDQRSELHSLLTRAYVVRAESACQIAPAEGVSAAQAVVALAPYEESSYVLLMRAYLAIGDRVQAASAYEQLRVSLKEFGLSPSATSAQLLRVVLDADSTVPAASMQLALPAVVVDATQQTFVARERELEVLAAVVDGKQAERVALVVGEPGIGKSRLVAEVAARAHAHGADVCVSVATDAQTVPYALVTDALTPLGVELPRPQRSFSTTLDPAETGAARQEVFKGYSAAIRVHAHRRSVVLVLDDLHWADAGSIDLLERLIEDVSDLRVVVTARQPEIDRSPAGPFVAGLHTRGMLVRFALRGLDAAAVAQIMRDDSPSFAATVCTATAGNPLYVHEIRRHIAASGLGAEHGDEMLLEMFGLPDGLAELIDANLARFGGPARQVLDGAAVIGDTFEVALVERCCDLSSGDALESLRTLHRAGVLAEISRRPRAVSRFAHPLVREVLLGGLTPQRRQMLHQRVAEAIEAYYHEDLDAHAPQLAYHFSVAANIGDDTSAVDFALRAAQRATAVFAFAEAVRWYEHVMRLLSDTPKSLRSIRALIALGDTHLRSGNLEQADECVAQALVQARATDDSRLYGEAVLTQARLLVDRGFEGGAVDNELVCHLQRAIARIDAPSALRAQLTARLASELHFAGDRTRCLELAHEAVAEARAADDPDAEYHTLSFLHYSLYGTPHVHQRLALLHDMQTLQTGRPDPRWQRDYLELGDLTAADHAAKIFERRAETSGFATDRYYPAVWRATRATIRGDFDQAEELANEAALIGRASARGPDAVAGVWAAQLFAVRLFDGRLDELRDIVDQTAELNVSRPIWNAAAAFMHLELDETSAARSHLEQVRSRGFNHLPDTLDLPLTLALSAWVAARVGTLDDCRRIYRRLRPYSDLCIVQGGPAPSVFAGPATYPLAMLAARLGREEEAHELLDQAITSAGRIHATVWLERMAQDRARLSHRIRPAPRLPSRTPL